MKLAIVSVGEEYCKMCEPHIERLTKNFQIEILTDNVKLFGEVKKYYYPYKIFSYFDKILFPLKLVEKYKENVLYVDVKWLGDINDEFLLSFNKNDDEFLYSDHWGMFKEDHWEKWTNFLDFKFDYFNPLYEYLGPVDFETIWENIIYIPYNNKISDLIYEIEKLKPVMEYMSVIGNHKYKDKGIGNGEGLALSYALNKCDFKKRKFKDKKTI